MLVTSTFKDQKEKGMTEHAQSITTESHTSQLR